MKRLYTLTLFTLFFIAIVWTVSRRTAPAITQIPQPTPQTMAVVITPFPSPTGAILGVQTKTDNCRAADGLQDSSCTPGSIFSDVTKDQICIPGYSKSVRNVPESKKKQVYNEYGIASHTAGEYEVDHLISLELGGSNDIANLWPEPAEPTPGFHQKDKVENYLHQQVCNGAMSLQDAQEIIRSDWRQVLPSLSH
jgi:hypothetical protein